MAARLPTYAVLWEHFGVRAETLAFGPETERRRWQHFARIGLVLAYSLPLPLLNILSGRIYFGLDPKVIRLLAL